MTSPELLDHWTTQERLSGRMTANTQRRILMMEAEVERLKAQNAKLLGAIESAQKDLEEFFRVNGFRV